MIYTQVPYFTVISIQSNLAHSNMYYNVNDGASAAGTKHTCTNRLAQPKNGSELAIKKKIRPLKNLLAIEFWDKVFFFFIYFICSVLYAKYTLQLCVISFRCVITKLPIKG